MAEMTSYKRIDGLRKGISVMDAVSRGGEAVSVQEIVRDTGMQQATVYCYLATLMDAGYLEQAGDRYKLGMALAAIWARKKAQVEADMKNLRTQLEELA